MPASVRACHINRVGMSYRAGAVVADDVGAVSGSAMCRA